MPRYRATLAYDGSAYCGFQRQIDGTPTIQAVLEDTLQRMTEEKIIVMGAGRTDTGVHATGQVIGFTVNNWRHDDATLFKALNAQLPPDIALQTLERATPKFHPRYDASARVYRYRVMTAEQRQPLWRHLAWNVQGKLDGEAMNSAAHHLLGKHDFAAFGQAPRKGGHTVRTITCSEWVVDPNAVGGTLWTYTVEGDAFLQHQVRRMVWALVQTGQGHMTPDAFRQLLESQTLSGGRGIAPPQGLTLEQVRYTTVDNPAGDETPDES